MLKQGLVRPTCRILTHCPDIIRADRGHSVEQAPLRPLVRARNNAPGRAVPVLDQGVTYGSDLVSVAADRPDIGRRGPRDSSELIEVSCDVGARDSNPLRAIPVLNKRIVGGGPKCNADSPHVARSDRCHGKQFVALGAWTVAGNYAPGRAAARFAARIDESRVVSHNRSARRNQGITPSEHDRGQQSNDPNRQLERLQAEHLSLPLSDAVASQRRSQRHLRDCVAVRLRASGTTIVEKAGYVKCVLCVCFRLYRSCTARPEKWNKPLQEDERRKTNKLQEHKAVLRGTFHDRGGPQRAIPMNNIALFRCSAVSLICATR